MDNFLFYTESRCFYDTNINQCIIINWTFIIKLRQDIMDNEKIMTHSDIDSY